MKKILLLLLFLLSTSFGESTYKAFPYTFPMVFAPAAEEVEASSSLIHHIYEHRARYKGYVKY